MYSENTDQDWECFAKKNPYWAVLTHDRFKNENMDNSARIDFLDSGEKYVDWIFKKINFYFDFNNNYSPRNVLDFGCGVGRLIIPLARRVNFVVGIDVSESMLKEASKNINESNIDNISLVKGDDELSKVVGKFDLINSFIVFQHIPTDRGYKLFSNLIERLENGGIGVLHFTYSKSGCHLVKTKRLSIDYLVRNTRKVIRKLTGRITPIMQMNSYSLNKILKILQEHGVNGIYIDFTNHDGNYGTILFFQKPLNNYPRFA